MLIVDGFDRIVGRSVVWEFTFPRINALVFIKMMTTCRTLSCSFEAVRHPSTSSQHVIITRECNSTSCRCFRRWDQARKSRRRESGLLRHTAQHSRPWCGILRRSHIYHDTDPPYTLPINQTIPSQLMWDMMWCEILIHISSFFVCFLSFD